MGQVKWFSGLQVLVTNHDGLSSVTGIQMVRGENQLATGCPLTSTRAEPQAHTHMHTQYKHIHIYK